MKNSIKSLLSSIINYTLPHRCTLCAELTEDKNGICLSCFQKLNFITSPYCNICGFPFAFATEGQASCGKCIIKPPKYSLGRSLLVFDQQSRHLVHAFKYHDKTSHAKMFAKLLVARYKSDLTDIDLIAPVPMHRFKRLFRNYNPAQILAKELSLLLDKGMIPDLLIKSKWTKPQTKLTKSQRQKNLSGSLKNNLKYNISGKTILLVDDVYTTGTTSNICSKLLKSAGAKNVKLVTIALRV